MRMGLTKYSTVVYGKYSGLRKVVYGKVQQFMKNVVYGNFESGGFPYILKRKLSTK
jgi:hypothetical protein